MSDGGGWARPESGSAGTPVVVAEAVRPGLGQSGRRDVSGPSAVPVPWLPVFERPLTMADALDGAFEIIRARPRTIAAFAMVFLLPMQVLVFAVDPHAYGGLAAILTDPEYFESSTSDSGLDATLLLLLLGTLPLSGVAAGVTKLVEGWFIGEERSAFECLRSIGWRRWVALVTAWLLVHVIEFVSILGFVLPVVFMTLFMITAPAVVLERSGPVAGMRRSWSLVSRRFWSSLWTALAAALVSGMVAAMLPLLPVGVAAIVGFGGDTIVGGVATMAATLFAETFVAGVAVLVYFDLRVRTEGLDLQLAVPAVYYSDVR